ncbi:MAG: EamA family transporter [Erysipelotrichaceae bacterium]|nr:EamA family transporter [Erysipelotrichaceae bacterium]
MKEKTARLHMAVSMILFGTIGIFSRNTQAITSGELALYRSILALILLSLLYRWAHHKIPWRKHKKEVRILILSGIFMAINWVLLFQAYRYTSIPVATLSYYFAPVIVTVASPILFNEPLTKNQITCFLIAAVGLVFIINLRESGGTSNLIGVLYGLGAAVFYAAVILLNKCTKRLLGIDKTFIQFCAGLIILVPYVLFFTGIHLHRLSFSGWISLLIIGFVLTGITYMFYFGSIRHLRGQEIALLGYLDPLIACLLSLLILHEAMTPLQVLGAGMILGSTLYNEIVNKEMPGK